MESVRIVDGPHAGQWLAEPAEPDGRGLHLVPDLSAAAIEERLGLEPLSHEEAAAIVDELVANGTILPPDGEG
jgi:hypothetical protein